LATASQLQHEQAIAQAARELVQLREAWLNPAPYSNPHPGPLPERERENAPLALAASRPAAARTREGREAGSEGEKKSRTLTNLYNARPTWLDNAHRKLDEAVCAAYGWPANLSDDDILARLLALNLKRAG
jgi:hypothetical protein